MNYDSAKVRLMWKSSSKAQRFTIGSRYVSVARFEDEREKYPAEAWSLVVEFDSVPDDSGTVLGNVRFLVEEAPANLLHSGSKFELYEGRKLVASGEII